MDQLTQCTDQASIFQSLTKTLYSFVVVVGVFVVGTGLGVVGGVLLTYDDPKDDDLEYIVPYDLRYFQDYFDTEVREMTDEEHQRIACKYVEDETPSGLVRMEYSKETGTFIWYGETSAVNRVLDTVARKFVSIHDCAGLYFNIYDSMHDEKIKYSEDLAQHNLAAAQAIADKTKPEGSGSDSDDSNGKSAEEYVVVKPKTSVFAKFKNTKTIQKNLDTPATRYKAAMDLAKTRINKYKKGGNIIDHDTLLTERCKKVAIVSTDKSLTFKMFMDRVADK